MRKIFRLRNVLIFLVVLLAVVPCLLVAGWTAVSIYSANYICEPGNHIIQSEADAINQAKTRFSRSRFYMGDNLPLGYSNEKPKLADFDSGGESCCSASRSREISGFITWRTQLKGVTLGEPKVRKIYIDMLLTNCGEVVRNESYIYASKLDGAD